MARQFHRLSTALALALVMAAIACTRSQVTPTTPTVESTPTSSGLKVTAPTPVSPVGGVRIEGFRPTLVINNARTESNAQATLLYRFELTDLSTGTVIYQSDPVAAGAGTTSHEVGSELAEERAFQWRARAEVPAVGNGPWSDTRTFDTPARPRTRPQPSTSATCIAATHQAVVECVRGQFGFMNSDALVEFLRRIAINMNASGLEHGPFGVLLKPGGHNCNGYSCDVICSGQGNGQRQWDVLGDSDGAQTPKWDRIPNIRADVCEIQ